MTTEVWKRINGFDKMYEVSTHGQVRSWAKHRGYPGRRKEPLIFKPGLANGYQFVYLSKNRCRKKFYVHTLVLTTFVGPCPPGMECCHGKEGKANNHVGNLRWDTHAANMRDALAQGSLLRGEAATWAKLTEEKVTEIRRLYAAGGISQRELGTQFGISQPGIGYIVRRKTWSHLDDKIAFDENTASTNRVAFARRGEACASAKLTEEQVAEIRSLYAAGDITLVTLGARFGVTDANISCIVRRKTWTHVDGGPVQ